MSSPKDELTVDQVRERLKYNPETGLFTWLSGPFVGKVAGTSDRFGYTRVWTMGRNHSAHRLAWLYVYGTHPKGEIDHINGIRNDNRIENLREVTRSTNLTNRSFGASGAKGVYRQGQKWRAQIRVNGVTKHIGTFATKEDAHQAYLAAEAERLSP